jgi:hypothetical protein
MELECAACIAFGPVEGDTVNDAVTIYDGNALCADHLDIGFSYQPVLRHKPDKDK